MDEISTNRALSRVAIMISESMEDPEWDNFLEKNEFGQYEQSSKWARVKRVYNWQPVRITIFRSGKIIGGVQILKKPVFFFGAVGYVSKGPVFSHYEKELFISLMDLLKAELKKHRIRYIILQPPNKAKVVEQWLVESGFQIDTNAGFIRATTMVDLSLDLDEINNRMSPKNRRNIKHGYKKGIKVKEGTEDDITIFFNLMINTCKRRNVKPNPPDAKFFLELWRCFSPSGNAMLFLSEYNNEIISGVFAIPYGDTLWAYKFGWSGEYGKLNPNQVLYWEIMKWAKKEGYHYFDFIAMNRNTAELILKGIHFTEVADGIDFIKLMFGGEVCILPDAYYYIYNPLLRFVYSKVFLKIICNPLFRKITISNISGIMQKYFSRINYRRVFSRIGRGMQDGEHKDDHISGNITRG